MGKLRNVVILDRIWIVFGERAAKKEAANADCLLSMAAPNLPWRRRRRRRMKPCWNPQ